MQFFAPIKKNPFFNEFFLNGRDDTIRTSDSGVIQAKCYLSQNCPQDTFARQSQAALQKKNPFFNEFFLNGRDDTIRTCDPFVPSEVRYQAALHPDNIFNFQNFFERSLVNLSFGSIEPPVLHCLPYSEPDI